MGCGYVYERNLRNLLSIALCVSPLPNLLSLQGPLTALLLTSLFACLVTCRARFPELIIAILSIFVDFAVSNLPRTKSFISMNSLSSLNAPCGSISVRQCPGVTSSSWALTGGFEAPPLVLVKFFSSPPLFIPENCPPVSL